LMTKERLNNVKHIFKKEWIYAFSQKKNNIILYEESKIILMKTACIWAGIPKSELAKINITGQLASLYEAGWAIGTRYWRGRLNRKRLNNWMEKLIIAVRQKKIHIDSDTSLYQIAFHRHVDGIYLDPKIAAVEIINILRPIVAIAVYMTFCALA